MADINAQKTGFWSDSSVWPSNIFPSANDNVYANGFTVTINTDIHVDTLNTVANPTGGTAGGGFVLSAFCVSRSNIRAGSTTALIFQTATPAESTIIGTLCASETTASVTTVVNNSTGVLNISGDALGDPSVSIQGTRAVNNNNNGVINLTGSVFGNSGGSGLNDSAHAIRNSLSGIFNIFGNVYAGAGLNNGAYGAYNTARGTINIYGDVYGTVGVNNQPLLGRQFGVYNAGQGAVNIFGNSFGGILDSSIGVYNAGLGTAVISGNAVGGRGSGAYGVLNDSTGIVIVKRAVGNGWGVLSAVTRTLASTPGVFSNSLSSQTFAEQLECGPRGQWPTGGIIYFLPGSEPFVKFITENYQTLTFKESSLEVESLLPPTSSVRDLVVYGLDQKTGTCYVPPPSSVALNVPVDNTRGTIGAFTVDSIWNTQTTQLTALTGSIGSRLRNTIPTDTALKILSSFNNLN